MKLTNEEFAKWQTWIERIKNDLVAIVDDQEVAVTFDEVIGENADWIKENHGGYFCDFVRRSHAVAALLAIRRHLDKDKESVSMLRLLSQLSTCAEQFTFKFYMQQFPEEPGQQGPWQRLTYGMLSENGETLNKAVVDADIADVQTTTKHLTDLATKTLAHLDHRGHNATVTYKAVRDGVNHLAELVNKYLGLIAGYSQSMKTSILFPWQNIFTVPLVKPKADAPNP